MRQIGAYLKYIRIEDGCVSILRKNNTDILERVSVNKKRYKDWDFTIDANFLYPKDTICLMAAGNVKLEMITKDLENDTFYDMKESILTDKLNFIRVRQFIVSNIYDVNKETLNKEGVVFADLEF